MTSGEWLEQVVGYAALSNPETLRESYDRAQTVIARGVQGDFVECGVFGGAQVAAMARAILDGPASDRKVHLFDSFKGIPKPGEHDSDITDWEAFRDQTLCPMKDVKDHMFRWGIPDSMLVYHEGMFEDTVPLVKDLKIAILRLDGDLYESTKVCLDHLYPMVVRGGWVIIDDWGLSGARKATVEFNLKGPAYFQKQD